MKRIDETSNIHEMAHGTSLAGEVAVARASSVAKPAFAIAMSTPICRIVTFHPNSLAALVASFPALVALRESFPGARLCSYVRAPLVPLLSCLRAVDETHARPGGGLSAQATLMARLRSSDFDLAISFSQGSNALLLTWATGASVRAGFVPSRFEAFLTHRVEKNAALSGLSALELVREVGAHSRGASVAEWFDVPTEAFSRADALLRQARIDEPFVLVAPLSAPRKTREEREAGGHWNEVVDEMANTWPLVVVAPGAMLSSTKHPVARAAKVDVLTLAALVQRARGVVGDDSGALALADLWNQKRVKLDDSDDFAALPRRAREAFGL